MRRFLLLLAVLRLFSWTIAGNCVSGAGTCPQICFSRSFYFSTVFSQVAIDYEEASKKCSRECLRKVTAYHSSLYDTQRKLGMISILQCNAGQVCIWSTFHINFSKSAQRFVKKKIEDLQSYTNQVLRDSTCQYIGSLVGKMTGILVNKMAIEQGLKQNPAGYSNVYHYTPGTQGAWESITSEAAESICKRFWPTESNNVGQSSTTAERQKGAGQTNKAKSKGKADPQDAEKKKIRYECTCLMKNTFTSISLDRSGFSEPRSFHVPNPQHSSTSSFNDKSGYWTDPSQSSSSGFSSSTHSGISEQSGSRIYSQHTPAPNQPEVLHKICSEVRMQDTMTFDSWQPILVGYGIWQTAVAELKDWVEAGNVDRAIKLMLLYPADQPQIPGVISRPQFCSDIPAGEAACPADSMISYPSGGNPATTYKMYGNSRHPGSGSASTSGTHESDLQIDFL